MTTALLFDSPTSRFIARVHLTFSHPSVDKTFDYLVPEHLQPQCVIGVSVRVPFAGRREDGFVVDIVSESDYPGALSDIVAVHHQIPVLSERLHALLSQLRERCGGTYADLLRLAIPPRRQLDDATVQFLQSSPRTVDSAPVALGSLWSGYTHSSEFVNAVCERRGPRAHTVVAPSHVWVELLAQMVLSCVSRGIQCTVIVPDQRDVDAFLAHMESLQAGACVELTSTIDPSLRYQRWLGFTAGHIPAVVGSRSAIYALGKTAGLVILWDELDTSLAEPRAPYVHTRLAALTRCHATGDALLIAGYSASVDTQFLVNSGWLVAMDAQRDGTPRVTAIDSQSPRQAEEAARGQHRLTPSVLGRIRSTVSGGGRVLVQVARTGYIPKLSCAGCRFAIECTHCGGPLQISGKYGASLSLASPTCAWCGTENQQPCCGRCGGTSVRYTGSGADKTAEDLAKNCRGAQVAVRTADRLQREDDSTNDADIVVCTAGMEPYQPYELVVILDTWATHGHSHLRSGENSVRVWACAAARAGWAQDGEVFIDAPLSVPAVQSLMMGNTRWWCNRELAQREELHLPPYSRLIAVDGDERVAEQVATAASELAEVLGPVEIPWQLPIPGGEEVSGARYIVKAPTAVAIPVVSELKSAVALSMKTNPKTSLRIQVDPDHMD